MGGEELVAIPTGWSDDGTRLTAPNGKSAVLGFRWHILTHAWAPDDWPLESEHYEPILDVTDPEHGDGIVQHFRKSILAWHENRAQVLELSSGAIALEWQQRAEASSGSRLGSSPDCLPPVEVMAYPGAVLPVGVAHVAAWRDINALAELHHSSYSFNLRAANAPERNAQLSAERLASLEKQVQMLISGLGAGAKPHEVARNIQDQVEMIATDSRASRRRESPLSNPRILLRWLLILIALLFADTLAWAISSLIHRQAALPLPLLALGTVALSAFFFFLRSIRPLSRP
ncbi:MAG: hypothetical protein C5B60_01990 [Chloroflexi bacterium]|nr:MAG: hypothetical protein C5B60_01990 [Chloroflexota bacterium]